MKTIFQQIAEKQREYYNMANEIRSMIFDVEGMSIVYKGQEAFVKEIYTDSTVDLIVVDHETDEQTEITVNLTDLSIDNLMEGKQ